MNQLPIEISSLSKEGSFQASKWLKIQALVGEEELEDLFKSVPELKIFSMRGVVQKDEIEISKEDFLKHYGSWIEKLKNGQVPTREDLSQLLSCVWTLDEEALYLVPVQQNSYLVKPRKPVVLIQAHFMGYSDLDQTFRPMILGENSIFWGLQFSFPQIFQRPDTKEFVKVDRSDEFRNTILFSQLRKWVRDQTCPTPFIIEEKRVNIPIRLGKSCFSWVQKHPQIIQKKLRVYVD